MGGIGSGRKHKVDYELLREYKAQGHTHKEVAEKFCVSEAISIAACKGVSPQRPDSEQARRKAIRQSVLSHLEREQKAVKVIEERAPLFEYIGGYTNSDGYVYLRCKKCGSVSHKSYVTVRHGKVECDNCKRIAAEKAKQEKEQQRKVEADKREWSKVGKRKAKQLSFSACKACGGLFFNERAGVEYCSSDCYNRANNAIKKDKRVRKLSAIVVDKGITLERLYAKSNGECALCGGQCNWQDHTIKDDGTFIVGATYPSIDHIKPISKGGMHEWKNIQLAHFACNSKKSNRV